MKKWLNLTAVLFSLLLLVILVSRSGLANLLEIGLGLRKDILLISLVPLLLHLFLTPYKWKVLLDHQKVHLSFSEVFRSTYIGMFFSFVTPSQLGDLGRIFYFDSKRYPQEIIAGTVVLNKIIELVTLLGLGVCGVFYYSHSLDPMILDVVFLFFLALSLFLFLFVYSPLGRPFFRKMFFLLMPKIWRGRTHGWFSNFYNSLPRLGEVIPFVLLSLINWLVVYTFVCLLALSLSINVGYVPLVLALALSSAIGLLPITISGIGTREVSLIALLGVFGVGEPRVLTLSLLGFFILKVSTALMGAFFALQWQLRFQNLEANSQ